MNLFLYYLGHHSVCKSEFSAFWFLVSHKKTKCFEPRNNMGNASSAILKNLSELVTLFKSSKKASLAILGLDNAGKTTLVNLFKEKNIQTFPTLGFNVDEVVIHGTKIKIWDVGGQREFITFWKQYVRDIDGLVFMIDIVDEKRYTASYQGFTSIVPHLEKNVPVLLLLNKIDSIKSADEISEKRKKIEEIYKAEDHGNGLVMTIGDAKFRCCGMEVSVKRELEGLADDGMANNGIRTQRVSDGFHWLLDEIKNGGHSFHA